MLENGMRKTGMLGKVCEIWTLILLINFDVLRGASHALTQVRNALRPRRHSPMLLYTRTYPTNSCEA
jgi:hypothetical protein